MATVAVSRVYAASVGDAEACWYDTGRWPDWVDGAARVLRVDDNWPRAGSSVVWESIPAGRGRVRETVSEYEPRAGTTAAVEDDSILGTQRVTFSPAPGGVEVELSLDYRMKRRTPVTPLIEWLFVRRPMTMSLTRTLERFGGVLR
ncbi:MAG TPA: SRPBCC family protein [Solirubrobacteraceae bacterium]|nr:SRPBCC family protein [Solirubrobacteraceae bacterium]